MIQSWTSLLLSLGFGCIFYKTHVPLNWTIEEEKKNYNSYICTVSEIVFNTSIINPMPNIKILMGVILSMYLNVQFVR